MRNQNRLDDVKYANMKTQIAMLLLAVCASAQEKAFEVVSIHPVTQLSVDELIARRAAGPGLRMDGAQASYSYISLKSLVMIAFQVKPYQVVTPDWMNSAYFDIAGKMPEGAT